MESALIHAKVNDYPATFAGADFNVSALDNQFNINLASVVLMGWIESSDELVCGELSLEYSLFETPQPSLNVSNFFTLPDDFRLLSVHFI